MSQQWFVQHGGKVVGPLSVAAIKKNVADGRIKPTTRLRLGDNGKWVHAESVNGLFPKEELPQLDDDFLADLDEIALAPGKRRFGQRRR